MSIFLKRRIGFSLERHLRYYIVLCFFFVVSQLFSQNKKFANTLLWEISGNGMAKPSYLYGTMHVSNKIAFHFRDSFFVALSSVDNVALELNPELWLSEMIHSETFNGIYNQYSRYSAQNKDFYTDATQINVSQSEIQATLVNNNKLINDLLYRYSNLSDSRNYEEYTFLDMYIYQCGKKLNKNIAGLEKFEQSLLMMFKAMMPDKTYENNPNLYEKNYDDAYSLTKKIEKAYRRNDLNEIDSLMKLSYFSKNYEKYLITERNKIMFHSMDSIMKKGSLFAGVGAAHLPGENGLLQMLEANGYQIKPVFGSETSYGKKMRSKIEAKTYNHSTSVFCTSDSSIQYILPSPLLKIPKEGEQEFLLYPDMVNGAYYAIYRIPHYGGLFARSEDYIYKQIDSILYESIPGKIIEKRIGRSNSGFSQMSIVSKLNSGDYMQFQIYFTPLEVIICKASGREKTYKSVQWKNFFSSIKFLNSSNTGPHNYSDTKLGFSINLPSNYSVLNYTNKTIDSRIQAFNPSDSVYYFISVNHFNDLYYIEDDSFELNYLAEKFEDQGSISLISRNSTIYNGLNALNAAYVYNSKPDTLNVKIIVNGNMYFILAAQGDIISAENDFFQTLSFDNNVEEYNFYTMTDSSLQFTTSTDNLNSNLLNELSSMMKNPDYSFNSQLFNNSFDYLQTEVYNSIHKPLSISVSRKKLDDYYYVPNIDTLWKKEIVNDFSISGNYIAKMIKNSYDSIFTISYYIKDSLSTRALWKKQILINNHLYTLTTLIDTTMETDIWQQRFYEDFSPWDTCPAFNLFEPKNNLFISDLNSKDSTLFHRAIYNIFSSSIIENNSDTDNELLKYISGQEFTKLSLSQRITIIQLAAQCKNKTKNLVKELEKIYIQSADTTELQFAVLGTLALLKDETSIQSIKYLMKYNLPLTNNKNQVIVLFDYISDSLDLAAMLFPEFLDYCPYTEYKQPVLDLLANLTINKKISPNQWSAEKDLIVREAIIELKRYNSFSSTYNEEDYAVNTDEYYYKVDQKTISSTIPWNDYDNYGNLAEYSVVLAPLYSEDERIKQFIDKVIKTRHRGLVYSCALSLQKYNQLKTDTIWLWLAEDDDSRMHFYDWLEVTNDTALYPKEFYNQKDMSISWLMEIITSSTIDSIRFIDKRLVTNAYHSGYLYFYKYKENEIWKINYVGFQPSDTTKMFSDFNYWDAYGIPLYNFDVDLEDKLITQSCNKIRLNGRRRVILSYNTDESNNFNFGDFDY